MVRDQPRNASTGVSPTLIGFLVVAVLAVIFFLQNGEQSEIDLWFFTWDTTIRWSLLVAMAIGVLLDRLFSLFWRRSRAKRA